MEQLNLSNTQRVRLTTMVNKLFPEYEVKFNHIQTDVNRSITTIQLSKNNPDFDISDGNSYPTIVHEFHWFEFCLLHLSEELVGNDFMNLRVSKSITTTSHIVDKLYDYYTENF
jgi:hypothetical protein